MRLSHYLCGIALSSALCLAETGGNTNVTIGQWDFNAGNLSATVGQPLAYVGSISNNTSFPTLQIGGASARVMAFPAGGTGEGYRVTHGAKANGGGTNVNEYTLIMDVMYPVESDFLFRALLQTGENQADDDAELFINPLGGLGLNGFYEGEITAGEWHRIAAVFDIPNDTLSKYVDGEFVGSQALTTQIDGVYSLKPTFLLFADDNGETAAGFVNSIQFRSEVLDAAAIEALGGPTAAGLPNSNPNDLTLEIVAAGANVQITVLGAGNFELQRKTALGDPFWTGVQNLPANTNKFTIPATGASGFFRARRL